MQKQRAHGGDDDSDSDSEEDEEEDDEQKEQEDASRMPLGLQPAPDGWHWDKMGPAGFCLRRDGGDQPGDPIYELIPTLQRMMGCPGPPALPGPNGSTGPAASVPVDDQKDEDAPMSGRTDPDLGGLMMS